MILCLAKKGKEKPAKRGFNARQICKVDDKKCNECEVSPTSMERERERESKSERVEQMKQLLQSKAQVLFV